MRILRPVIVLGLLAALTAAPAAAYKVKDVPLPAGTVGVAYSFQFEAVGGTPPHSFIVLTGGLPDGLDLASSGRLSGVPTKAGSWSFWIQAKDGNVSKSERRFTLDVRPRSGSGGGSGGGTTTPPPPPPAPPQPLQIRNTEFAPAAVGVAYSDAVRVSGGTVTGWSIVGGALPQGLTLGSTGTITGTPRSVGTSSFTVRISDGQRTVDKQLAIRVVPAMIVKVPPIAPVVVGDRFETHPTVKGGAAPYRWSVTGITAGQVGVGADGTVAGDGRKAGSYSFALVVADAAGQKTQARLKLVVNPLLGITTKTLPGATRGVPYRARVRVVGGVAPRTLALVGGTLPTGITFSPRTGRLVGMVPAGAPPSSTLLWFQVTDRRGDTFRASLTLSVT